MTSFALFPNYIGPFYNYNILYNTQHEVLSADGVLLAFPKC